MNICPIKGVCRESNHVISVTVMSPLIIGTGTDGVTLNKYLINRWSDRWVNENRVSRNLEGDNAIKHWCRKQKMIHLTKQFQNVSSVSGCVLDIMTQDIRIRLLSSAQVPHLGPFNSCYTFTTVNFTFWQAYLCISSRFLGTLSDPVYSSRIKL